MSGYAEPNPDGYRPIGAQRAAIEYGAILAATLAFELFATTRIALLLLVALSWGWIWVNNRRLVATVRGRSYAVNGYSAATHRSEARALRIITSIVAVFAALAILFVGTDA